MSEGWSLAAAPEASQLGFGYCQGSSGWSLDWSGRVARASQCLVDLLTPARLLRAVLVFLSLYFIN